MQIFITSLLSIRYKKLFWIFVSILLLLIDNCEVEICISTKLYINFINILLQISIAFLLSIKYKKLL